MMVGMVGIEPTLPFGNGFLRPARLPIPPRPHCQTMRKSEKNAFGSPKEGAIIGANPRSVKHLAQPISQKTCALGQADLAE